MIDGALYSKNQFDIQTNSLVISGLLFEIYICYFMDNISILIFKQQINIRSHLKNRILTQGQGGTEF